LFHYAVFERCAQFGEGIKWCRQAVLVLMIETAVAPPCVLEAAANIPR
jgi:hypothetical protein